MVLSEKVRSESFPMAPNELSPQAEEAAMLYQHQQRQEALEKEQHESGFIQANPLCNELKTADVCGTRSQDSGINLSYPESDNQKNIIER